MKTPLLILAALSLAAAPARADYLSDATQGWSTDIKPAKDWEKLEFTDENGDAQTLFFQTSKFQIGVDPPATGDVPLFKLDPSPASSQLTMDGHDNEVRTFKDNKLSAYYIKAPASGGLSLFGGYSADVSRHDKPELVIHVAVLKIEPAPIDFSKIDFRGLSTSGSGSSAILTPAQACIWCPGAYPAPNDGNWTRDYISRLKVIVYTPTSMDTAKATPITGTLEENACEKDNVESYFKQPSGSMTIMQQLWLGFIPAEVELQAAALTPQLTGNALYGTDAFSDAYSGLNHGAFGPANAFIADARARIQAAAATARGAMAAGQPEASFTAFESRWLVCRIRHQGALAKASFKSSLDALAAKPAATRADASKKFVADWRRFLIAEIDAYASESQGLPSFPDKPDHAKLDKALHDRTAKAVGSSGSQAVSAGPTRIGAAQGQRVDRTAGTIDDILNQ